MTMSDPMTTIPTTEEVSFEIIRHGVDAAVSRAMLMNVNVHVLPDFMHDMIVVRLTQRLLARRAEETVVTATERVPANWWSHLLVTITGDPIPEGYGWRWKLYRRAQWRRIETRTTFYRSCPHVQIPDNLTHLRWMMYVDEDARMAHLQRKR